MKIFRVKTKEDFEMYRVIDMFSSIMFAGVVTAFVGLNWDAITIIAFGIIASVASYERGASENKGSSHTPNKKRVGKGWGG